MVRFLEAILLAGDAPCGVPCGVSCSVGMEEPFAFRSLRLSESTRAVAEPFPEFPTEGTAFDFDAEGLVEAPRVNCSTSFEA